MMFVQLSLSPLCRAELGPPCPLIPRGNRPRKMVFGLRALCETVIPFNAAIRQTGYYQLGFLRVAESDSNAVKKRFARFALAEAMSLKRATARCVERKTVAQV
jgi:hypothetical protein